MLKKKNITIKKLKIYIEDVIDSIYWVYPNLESHRNDDKLDYHRGQLASLLGILETINDKDL